MGDRSSILGVAAILGMGVIVIAGIVQLGKKGNPVVPSATNAYNNTLNNLFK